MFKKVESRFNPSQMEQEVLNFWEENKTFEKSLDARKDAEFFSFYDGPPFATGLPHYGHLLGSTSKDVCGRYWTMKGYYVPRRWGWDTHGLPIENIVEKELGYESKKEIEENIGEFNGKARSMVLNFADEWRQMIKRLGRWVDFDNSYKTMDNSYIESVWWAFKELDKKGLVYKDSRISLYCTRCSTPLSNFEVAMDNSYQEVKDVSVYVKMKVKGEDDTYFIVWTTTPWTLPANVALAVNPEETYVKVKIEDENLILVKDRLEELLEEEVKYEVTSEMKGSELKGLEYKPLFPADIKNGYRVVTADFVTTEDGSGIVHIAPAFGEDDFNVRKQNDLPIIENVDEEGKYIDGEWKGQNVWEANFKVLGKLNEMGVVFKKVNIKHSYPHCHRCETKLVYKSQPAWFIDVSKIKDELIKQNEEINWHPENLKHGRFGKGLETAPDWNVSRSRYWGNPMPIWECEKCKKVEIIGSFDELKKKSGKSLKDYHRPFIDELTYQCDECEAHMRRIPDVFDCWLESASMPFAEFHYPFENEQRFKKGYPAQFISEYIAQTRAWFYVMHVLSVALFGKPSFKNVVTTGTILAEDGQKMSKSKKNFPDPSLVLDKYGADALRFYLMGSPVMLAQNFNFSEKDLGEVVKGMIRMLWNTYSFFTLYANIDKWDSKKSDLDSNNMLDKWILSKLNQLTKEVNKNMEGYEITKAVRLFPSFVDDLSNWYVRRSRKRFWKSENDNDKDYAYSTLHHVLVELSKLMAPFTPFVSEEIYKNLTGDESVHLTDYPKVNEKMIDQDLNEKMASLRELINAGLAQRAESGIKVRQPLARVNVKRNILNDEMKEILKEELNVKDVEVDEKLEDEIKIDTEITDELKLEGVAREVIRRIQQMRKEAGYEVDNRIEVYYQTKSKVFESFGEMISKEILANNVNSELSGEIDLEKEFEVEGDRFKVQVKR